MVVVTVQVVGHPRRREVRVRAGPAQPRGSQLDLRPFVANPRARGLSLVVHLLCAWSQSSPARRHTLKPFDRTGVGLAIHALPRALCPRPLPALATNMTPIRQLDGADVPSSPDDGSNFKRGLQIDMKGLVGDAVGNVGRNDASA